MDKELMDKALLDAKSSLAEVSAKMSRLKAKMDALQNVVSGIEALLGTRPTLELTPQEQSSSTGRNGLRTESTWKLAQNALAASGIPMTVPEIFAAIEQKGLTPPAKDAIRIAMMRKPEIFLNANGKYRLVPEMEELLGGIVKEQEATEVAS
jgi:hypothetical protein